MDAAQMKKESLDVVVFGTGQLADIAHVLLEHDSPYRVAAFTVDADHLPPQKTHRGLPLTAFEELPESYPNEKFRLFIPISAKRMNRLREEKYTAAKQMGYRCISYISSHATVLPESRIGENCFIFENNVIQPFAKIGDNVVLWSGNHIGHHSEIKSHNFLTSHIVVSGNVTIEPYCYLGVNATLRDGITIASGTIIGAGALVLKDTREKEVYLGPMARPHSKTSDEVEIQ